MRSIGRFLHDRELRGQVAKLLVDVTRYRGRFDERTKRFGRLIAARAGLFHKDAKSGCRHASCVPLLAAGSTNGISCSGVLRSIRNGRRRGLRANVRVDLLGDSLSDPRHVRASRQQCRAERLVRHAPSSVLAPYALDARCHRGYRQRSPLLA